MLLSKVVKVKWHSKNRSHFEELGYVFTKWNDEFNVETKDLPKGSHVYVRVKCDGEKCNNPYLSPVKWQSYLRCIKPDEKYYCSKCVSQERVENGVRTRLLKSKSFEQWCIENKKQDLLERWDYEANSYLPSEIGYASNKKCYFKCPKGLHKSELKNINMITNLRYKDNYNIFCNACNSFAQWGIDNICEDFLEKYWDYEKNNKLGIDPWTITYGCHKKVYFICQEKEYHESYDMLCNNFIKGYRCRYCATFHGSVHPLDSLGKILEKKGLLHIWSDKNKKSPYEYTPNSIQEVWWKCHNHEHDEYKRNINDSNTCQFRCPECGFSKGETRVDGYLSKNNIFRIPQKEFDGLIGLGGKNLSYDFYLPKYNLLIEYQGEMHERFVNGIHKSKKDFERQQEHDIRKREYAEKNNIKLLEIWYWDFDNIEKILKENNII